MIKSTYAFAAIAALAAAAAITTIGCEPEGPQPAVVVPPAPTGVEANSPGGEQYRYDHQVRYGGADSEMKQQLRRQYVLAIARVADTSLVDTPFGNKQVASPVVAVVAGAEGQGDTKVTAAIDESLRNERLAPEPAPPGFTQRTRTQLISFLQETECFTLIERESINDIVRELEFDDSRWVAKTPETPAQGKLSGVKYIVKGALERNLAARPVGPATPDNWVGQVGFPEDDRQNMPLVFRLRMYSVSGGIIVAVGDGYGRTADEAVKNSVRALTRLVIRNYHRDSK